MASDFAKVDAHVIQPEEYEEIPELTDEWFDRGTLMVNGEPVRDPADLNDVLRRAAGL